MKKLLCTFLIASLVLTTGAGFVPDKAAAASKDKPYVAKLEKKAAKQKPKYKKGEVLVLYKEGAAKTKAKAKAATALTVEENFKVAELWTFEGVEAGSTAPKSKAATTSAASDVSVSIGLIRSGKLSTKQLITKLKHNKLVEFVEPNYACKATALTNDPYINKQWGLENNGNNGGTAGMSTNVNEMWSKGFTGDEEQVIAVIDTGVDYTHEDLADNMWTNPYQARLAGKHGFNFYSGTTDPKDDNGHGTHVAGIIGAKGDNNKGISGVNQNTKIMALKFLSAGGWGWEEDAIAAYSYINRAINLGVNVTAINNSWGPIDGSEEMEYYGGNILGRAMEIVGKKGALSICAAGNEEYDFDQIRGENENPYKITVAASNEKNGLASFSNYGAESVDMAAPGTNILSTVSYDCFNPSLYEDDSLFSNSGTNYADYDNGPLSSLVFGEPEIDTTLNPNCEADLDTDNFFGDAGSSLVLKLTNANEGDFVTVRVPYTLQATDTVPKISAMVKTKGPEAQAQEIFEGWFWRIPSWFDIVDVASGQEVDNAYMLEEYFWWYDYTYISGEQDYWTRLSPLCKAKKSANPQTRDLLFIIECNYDGDYEINIDDLGISKENADPKDFGRYDFYSGTSMAAPFVTGAAALMKQEKPELKPAGVADHVKVAVNENDFPIDTLLNNGSLDFTKATTPPPQISEAKVSLPDNTITITGRNFLKGTNEEVNVKINNTDAEIISQTNTKLVIENINWINKKVNITVSNSIGAKTKKDVYLVKGKIPYKFLGWAEGDYYDEDYDDEEYYWDETLSTMTSDGKTLFGAYDYDDYLYKYNARYQYFSPAIRVDTKKIFNQKKNDIIDAYLQYFQFGKDLVCLDGKIYNIGALCEGVENWDDEDDWYYEDEWDYWDYMYDYNLTAYSQEPRLLEMDAKLKKKADRCKSLGELPKDIENTIYYSLASYDGKLYVIGGYDYNKNALTKKVKIYNPKTKKWSNGPNLPEGRAAGRALQCGDKLVYTLGYTDGPDCPKNLILEGKEWSMSTKAITPYQSKTETISDKEYTLYMASIGAAKNGLIYCGMPSAGLGDTFTYNVTTDKFAATKYNHITNLKMQSMIGAAVGNKLYGVDDLGKLYLAKISSGLLKVSAPKYKGGSIKGANSGVLPGTLVTLTATPKKGYKLQSFTVDGKAVKGKTIKVRLTKDIKAKAKFVKI